MTMRDSPKNKQKIYMKSETKRMKKQRSGKYLQQKLTWHFLMSES